MYSTKLTAQPATRSELPEAKVQIRILTNSEGSPLGANYCGDTILTRSWQHHVPSSPAPTQPSRTSWTSTRSPSQPSTTARRLQPRPSRPPLLRSALRHNDPDGSDYAGAPASTSSPIAKPGQRPDPRRRQRACLSFTQLTAVRQAVMNMLSLAVANEDEYRCTAYFGRARRIETWRLGPRMEVCMRVGTVLRW